MFVLASFVVSVLLLVGWGRPGDLLFYVPVACCGLLTVWLAGKQNRYTRPKPRNLAVNPRWREIALGTVGVI